MNASHAVFLPNFVVPEGVGESNFDRFGYLPKLASGMLVGAQSSSFCERINSVGKDVCHDQRQSLLPDAIDDATTLRMNRALIPKLKLLFPRIYRADVTTATAESEFDCSFAADTLNDIFLTND